MVRRAECAPVLDRGRLLVILGPPEFFDDFLPCIDAPAGI